MGSGESVTRRARHGVRQHNRLPRAAPGDGTDLRGRRVREHRLRPAEFIQDRCARAYLWRRLPGRRRRLGSERDTALRLGHDTPDTAAEADAAKAAEVEAEKQKKKKGDEEEAPEEAKPEDPNAKFFSQSDGATSMFDASKLNLDDEFAEELDQRAKAQFLK